MKTKRSCATCKWLRRDGECEWSKLAKRPGDGYACDVWRRGRSEVPRLRLWTLTLLWALLALLAFVLATLALLALLAGVDAFAEMLRGVTR